MLHVVSFSLEQYNNNIEKSLRECWEQAWECEERKNRKDSEAEVDKLKQDENESLEPSVNLQQLRRQTSAVVNVDMLGTSKERQWT